MWRNRFAAALSAIAVLAAARAFADLDRSYVLPLDDWAIQHATRPLADPVTLLQRRIKRGENALPIEAFKTRSTRKRTLHRGIDP